MVPARAGVIPIRKERYGIEIGGSRASGGDPGIDNWYYLKSGWFPRERG